jgi:hypothetical protein
LTIGYRAIVREGVAVHGIVVAVNKVTEMFIVKHEEGCSVVEPIGYLVSLGDVIIMESAIVQAVVPTYGAARRRI